MNNPFAECANCNHYPIWHAGGWRRVFPWLAATFCSAWNPDKPRGVCACPGWSPK